MTTRKRPLSPHLSVYKGQISSVVSVMQRISGGALAVGLGFMVYWLGAAAYGPETYATAQWFLTTWFGYLCLFGFSAAIYFHLCNGIRHLIWDIGIGFEIHQVNLGGILVLAATAGLTVLTWVVIFAKMGGAS
ncbi:MAG: succinate dehydrogenase, cytochrome b556 subunit [Alphaproteobacteria bacterium]|nr:succinate dehydrogenase, cytochrome b556 subunit [Alphaproteobacteria bacterium]